MQEELKGADYNDESDLLVIHGFGKPNSMQRKFDHLKVYFSRVPKTIEYVEVSQVDKSVTLK
jgi:hypothetical protein